MSPHPPLPISVVMPLKDKAPWVEDAVRSVLEQTHAELELIVVDDVSSDASLDRVPRGDPRLRVVRGSGQGPGAARNRGVAAARSSWVAFLDADDAWEPGFLGAIVDHVRAHPDHVAVFTNIRVLPSRRLLLDEVPTADAGVMDYFEAALGNRGWGMTCSSTAVRVDALRACGGFAEAARLGEDADTWARLAWSGPVGYIQRPLAVHREFVAGSLTARARASRLPRERPLVASTWEAWRQAGRIPAALAASSERMARQAVFEWAALLARRRDWGGLRRALRSDGARLGAKASAGLLARAVLPSRALDALGRWRRGATRLRWPMARPLAPAHHGAPLREPT